MIINQLLVSSHYSIYIIEYWQTRGASNKKHIALHEVVPHHFIELRDMVPLLIRSSIPISDHS